ERNLFLHLLPLLIAGIAASLIILAPFWAADWYRTPFLGMLLEPNNVVSQITSPGWPARSTGVIFADRLLALDGRPINDASALMKFLQQNGMQPVQASFARRAGGTFELTITPLAHPPLSDLFTLFIVPYLVGLVFIGIGIWAYTLRGDQRAGRTLLAFTSALSIATTSFLDMDTTRHAVLLWALSLGIMGASLVHLSFVFPQPMRFILRRPSLRWLGWIVFILLAIPTTLAIIRSPGPYFYINTWQWGYLFITVGFVLFLGTLIHHMFQSNLSHVRQQCRVIIFGAMIAFIPTLYYITPLAFGLFTQFYAWLVFPALIIFPLSITYAIVRYRLLDVDRFFSRALAYLLTLGVALAAFYAILALISLLLQRVVRANDPLTVAAYLLLLVIGFNPVRSLFQQGIDRLFYRAPADYRRALTSLSRNLAITPDLNRTLHTLEDQIIQALAPEKFVLYLYNDDLEEYFPHATHEDSAPPYQIEDPLIQLIASVQTPSWFPTDGPLPTPLQNPASSYRRLMGSTIVPLHYESKLIGFMMLGPRRSGDLYTSDDLDFLAAVASQSVLALENARLFANLRHTLDQTLEMKNMMDDIFASIASGIITTDLDRRVTLLNRAAENILGVNVSRVIGEPLAKAVPVLGVELEDAASNTLNKGETVTSTELSDKVPERGDLYLRLSVSPLRDAYLGTKGATLVFEDLTERHKLEAERELIRKTFGHVVAPRVRDRLLANPDNLRLDGTKQVVTALFADMSGFTSFSEKRDPETVFSVLNQYLALAAQAILDEEGTLDKFMGDAVLAIWNSPDPQPDHALRAARAALNIVQRSMNAHHNLMDPEQHMLFRIGITTGPAITGNVGTTELFNYTAIGDTVNLAQRLQSSARRGQILLQITTYEIIKNFVDAEALIPIAVKGREQAAEVYELKGLKK
ncbi:MAG TPA: adenylate/guanylate cyclase domain-containing protein, partial [Anaerolineales bacterium]|nr:adenylate/guanylate cyclase domain-containing protein [Anaerolineales bacterium]